MPSYDGKRLSDIEMPLNRLNRCGIDICNAQGLEYAEWVSPS